MNQSSFNTRSNFSEFTKDEIVVADILFGLRDEIPFRWIGKKQRSNTELSFLSRLQESYVKQKQQQQQQQQQPLPPPTSSLLSCAAIVGPAVEAESDKTAVKVEASSPATPLSFPPSESDERPKRLKPTKASAAKTKLEWVEILSLNTKTKESLEEELKKVRLRYEMLKADNLSLKERKQQLSVVGINKSLNLETKQGQNSSIATNNQIHVQAQWFHQQPFLVDPTAINNTPSTVSEMSENSQYPYEKMVSIFTSGNGFCIENVGPRSLPDLNGTPPPLESSLFYNKSYCKAMAAQARFRRAQIRREKNPNGSNSKLALSQR